MNGTLQKWFSHNISFLIFLVLFLVSSVIEGEFASLANMNNLLMQVSVLGIVAIGQTIVMIAKGFDLSVGVVVSLAGIVTVYMQPYGLVVAIVAGILVGVLVGMINGFTITRLNINPLIATLGSMTLVSGITLGVTNQNPVSGTNMNFMMLSSNLIDWLPLPFLILVVLLFASDLLLKKYRLGREIFAIGGNSDAAEYSGIKTARVRFISYVLCSTLAAIGGILMASFLNTGSPIAGNGMELATIAAVVLGGTKLTGGAGSVWGTFWGVLILNILSNLLDLTGVKSYYQTGLQGGVLILVVIITTLSARRKKAKSGMLRTFH